MNKIIILLIFITKIVFACTLCTPIIEVDVKRNIVEDKTTFNITWLFSKVFTQQTMQSYPDRHIELRLQEIKEAIEGYTSEKNYCTFITYDDGKTYEINELPNSTFSLKSDQFIYKYSVITNITKMQNEKLNIRFKDDKDYFLFSFRKNNIIDEVQSPVAKFLKYLSQALQNLTSDMQDLLKDIEKSNSFISYFWLLSFSFLYGILHAIGPGHGKSLISSYFLREKSSHLKALGMSSLIGVVHTFSAFLLTLVVYYSVNTFLGSLFTDIEKMATKISAIIIICIAVFLIYKKIIKHKHQSHCGCSGCKTQSTDIGIILAAGIVPCAGTVTIFIYTMSLNLYFIGFLSAIFMSLGMSLIIYLTALLSIKIRDKASVSTSLLKIFEYGSLVFILCLGIILLIV